MIIRVVILAAVLLAGCNAFGDFDLPPESAGSSGGGAVEVQDCDTLFRDHVQPRLDYCRNCHVPGGVADVDDGRKYQLSNDPAQDYDDLYASWERLGRNQDPPNLILRMASGTDARSHTGGSPWPVDSDAYREMEALLNGFEDPAACMTTTGGGEASPQ